MLCNLQSASSYMQAAFRVQNLCLMTRNGQCLRKERAYVFDFDPARTLDLFDEFANNLSPSTVAGRGTSDDRKENIRRLLNFFPVLGEDDEGTMVELDATAVLSIPRRLKSQEVVRRGFLSNFLFRNISNVFGAPSVVREIVEKLAPAHEEKQRRDPRRLDGMQTVPVDANGEVKIPSTVVIGKTQELFGPKIYETITTDVQSQVEAVVGDGSADAVKQGVRKVANAVKRELMDKVLTPAVKKYSPGKGVQKKLTRQVKQEVDRKLETIRRDYEQESKIAQATLTQRRQEAKTPQEVAAAEADHRSTMDGAMQALQKSVEQEVQRTIEKKPQEVVEQLKRHQEVQRKRLVEEEVQAHLRGFSRTIPSFIMAYGDGHLHWLTSTATQSRTSSWKSQVSRWTTFVFSGTAATIVIRRRGSCVTLSDICSMRLYSTTQ